jgi:DNA repair exonuclease SbcCD ATPase subunit
MVDIQTLEEKVSQYELNKEVIENLENLSQKRKSLKIKSQNFQNNFDTCNVQILDLYKTVGSLEQKVSNITTQRGEYLDLQEEFSAYDLYMRAMHPNGIAYDVIRRKLPIINEEIAKILANIVEFEVFFEDDGKRLDIYIKHPSFDPRPLEMGSGAEKTIAAMAIRLALLSVSSLPKSDIFILDEPGTALDEENMQGFVDILDLIKSYFKTVLLISHLDSLKDCVDMQITIDKKNGYAFIQQ